MPVLRPKKLSDLELLKRLKDLSWLSAAQLKELNEAMLVRNVKRDGVIYQELGARSAEKHILLSGTAQLNRLNGDGPRVVAMIMPGLIFRLPQMPPEVGHNFEWVALSDSRVGRLPIELSRRVRAVAKQRKVSLNAFLIDALPKAVASPPAPARKGV